MLSQPRSNRPNLDPYWMPFTASHQFKAMPRMLIAAEGMHYVAEDGREVLDGTAGLWCVNAGHGRRRIAQAVERQLATPDYAPSSRWVIQLLSTSRNVSRLSRQEGLTVYLSPAPAPSQLRPASRASLAVAAG